MTSESGRQQERANPRFGRDRANRRRLVFGLSLAEDVLYAAVALVLIRRSPSGNDDGDMLD